jgi:hypothetical protein
MPLHFPDNRYPGVNAHLNSYLQQPNGTWSSFHHDFITTLKRHLNRALPPNYFAIAERGLQISETSENLVAKRRTLPDVSIIQRHPTGVAPRQSSTSNAPTASIPLIDTLSIEDDENTIIRIGIYQSETDNVRGKLVTAVEVLSPSNKPYRSNYEDYIVKRTQFLIAGINLIEVDLIHEIKPVTLKIPSYVDSEDDAQPYNIIVSIPQPDIDSGKLDWYGVEVDKSLPKIDIPLVAGEFAVLDVNAAYNDVFTETPFFSLEVDYEKLPVNFERYSATDQQRIKDILERIRKDPTKRASNPQ